MSVGRLFAYVTGGSIITGSTSAAITAAAGAVGTAIVYSSAPDRADMVREGSLVGALGGAVLGGISGGAVGGLVAQGLFKFSQRSQIPGSIRTSLAVGGATMLNGLVGLGLLNAARDSLLSLGDTAKTFALGGLVFSMSAFVTYHCVAIPLAKCLHLNAVPENNQTPMPPPPYSRI